MEIKISYANAKQRYPEQVADVTKQIRNSGSKFRDTEPASWGWVFSWSLRATGGTPRQWLERATTSGDTEGTDTLARCSCWLRAYVKPNATFRSAPLPTPPSEIAEIIE